MRFDFVKGFRLRRCFLRLLACGRSDNLQAFKFKQVRNALGFGVQVGELLGNGLVFVLGSGDAGFGGRDCSSHRQ